MNTSKLGTKVTILSNSVVLYLSSHETVIFVQKIKEDFFTICREKSLGEVGDSCPNPVK